MRNFVDKISSYKHPLRISEKRLLHKFPSFRLQWYQYSCQLFGNLIASPHPLSQEGIFSWSKSHYMTLKIEATCPFETSIDFQRGILCYVSRENAFLMTSMFLAFGEAKSIKQESGFDLGAFFLRIRSTSHCHHIHSSQSWGKRLTSGRGWMQYEEQR
jgi:hypothetical protein